MSESETKKYDTNPLDKRVAERAEAAMEESFAESEAPTREMPPELRPIAGGSTQADLSTGAAGGDTSHVRAFDSGPVAQPHTGGIYTPPDPQYAPPPHAYGPPPAGMPYAGPNQAPPGYAQQPHGYPAPQYPHTGTFRDEGSAALGLKPNFAAMAAYVPFVGAIISFLLVLKEPKRNRFVRFHAKQALIGHIAFWAIQFGLRTASNNAPGVVSFMLAFPMIALYVGYVAGYVMMMSKAYQSEKFKIPIIGDQAE